MASKNSVVLLMTVVSLHVLVTATSLPITGKKGHVH